MGCAIAGGDAMHQPVARRRMACASWTKPLQLSGGKARPQDEAFQLLEVVDLGADRGDRAALLQTQGTDDWCELSSARHDQAQVS